MAQRARFLRIAFILLALAASGHRVSVLVDSSPSVSGLYVANAAADSITVYDPQADGNVVPIRTISGLLTGLKMPYAVAVDAAGNLYVANGPVSKITVYAPGASGNVSPLRTISGSLTGLSNPIGVALDPAGTLYVANYNSITSRITVYAPGASGNAAPLRTISGPLTGLSSARGVVLDASGNLYATNGDTHKGYPDSVVVYAPGATGNVKPIRAIKGGVLTGLAGAHGMALDAAGALYVANFVGRSVTVYAPGATGNVAPLRTIRVEQPMLVDMETPGNPTGVALDATGSIYVANFAAHSITVYAAGVSGSVAPIRTISGANTGLNRPEAIFLRP